MGESAKAWVIGHITIKDPERWAQYCSAVPATIAPWKGEVLLRAKRVAVLAGEHDRAETVVLHFPNLDSIDTWYRSDGYQALIPLREQAADVDLISFSG
jgi:uncharacterized protein (DUF1330 family)